MIFLHATPLDLDRILASTQLDGAIAAAIVTDMDGKVLYQHNADVHVVPASNQKLISNTFALWALGPLYRPLTSFWKQSDRIVVDSTGDPLMSYKDLLHARQILDIRKKLPVYVRQQYAPQIPDSWEVDDLPNRYCAAVTAFTFDRGAFEAWSKDGKAILLPESFGVQVLSVPSKDKVEVQYDPFARKVTIKGAVPSKEGVLDTLALPRPDEAAASIFGAPMRETQDLPNRPPDYIISGGSVEEMVEKCLPPSDNNIAENLLLLGARSEGALGAKPYDVARTRAEKFLTRVVGVDPKDIHVFDGSGMSRHNYVTARAISKILEWQDKQPTSDLFHQALAHPGTGTLTRRLKGLAFQGKTGSLDMVSSLSGYLTCKSGKKVIVSIILNEFGCSAADARAVQDEFVTAVSND